MKTSRRQFLSTSSALATLALLNLPLNALQAQQAYSEVTALSYVPYSTSYLSLRDGDFVRRALSGGLSLAQKFDRAGQTLYGARWPNLQDFYASYHRQGAERFEGKCHQWTAGAHDVALQNLITQTGGIQCGDVTFSIPELRELVTAFYTPRARRHDFGTQPHRTNQIRFIRNEIGVDVISAVTFHKEIHRSLRAHEGVGMDIGPEGQIWNYPVFRMESTLNRISVSEHRGIPLPPVVISAGARSEYENVYNLLKTYGTRTDELQDMDMGRTQAYVNQAKNFFNQVKAYADQSVEVYRVRSVVHHTGVSRFASGSQETKRKIFEYFLVARRTGGNGLDYIDGAWISPVSEQGGLSHFLSSDDGRPARLWFPAPLASLNPVDQLLVPGSFDSKSSELVSPERPALQALVTMLQRCQRLK